MELLADFYSKVDKKTKLLMQENISAIKCKIGCCDCCIDGITVFLIEAENIKKNHSDLLKVGIAASEGKCAFLNNAGECRIYSDRPYVCRTQGLFLRWTETVDDNEVYEYRDTCPVNDDSEILTLGEDKFLLIGDFEDDLQKLQFDEYQNYKRLELRSLFHRV